MCLTKVKSQSFLGVRNCAGITPTRLSEVSSCIVSQATTKRAWADNPKREAGFEPATCGFQSAIAPISLA